MVWTHTHNSSQRWEGRIRICCGKKSIKMNVRVPWLKNCSQLIRQSWGCTWERRRSPLKLTWLTQVHWHLKFGKQKTAGADHTLFTCCRVERIPAAGSPLHVELLLKRARLCEITSFYFCPQLWSASLVRVKATISQSCQYFRNWSYCTTLSSLPGEVCIIFFFSNLFLAFYLRWLRWRCPENLGLLFNLFLTSQTCLCFDCFEHSAWTWSLERVLLIFLCVYVCVGISILDAVLFESNPNQYFWGFWFILQCQKFLT